MAHEYCCCAVPLLNIGIYLVLLEQFILGITAGTVSLATPKIVGAALPSFAPWIFAIVCYLVAAVQVLGFIGVSRENPKLYRTYTAINSLAVSAAFGVAAGFIGLSWGRHNTAVTNCITNFFTSNGTTETDSKSQTLCKIFTYVDEGVMTGLCVLLAILQFYFVLVTRFYGKTQTEDHKKYFSVYGDGSPDDILLDERPAGDAWDHRSPPMSPSRAISPPIGGSGAGGQYQHVRQASNASTIMNEPYQQPNASPYEHYPNPTIATMGGDPHGMHDGSHYRDDDEHYDAPPGEPSYQSHPQGGYQYEDSPPQHQHSQSPPQHQQPEPYPDYEPQSSYPTSTPSYYTTPTPAPAQPSVPPDQPRYQLYDKKI